MNFRTILNLASFVQDKHKQAKDYQRQYEDTLTAITEARQTVERLFGYVVTIHRDDRVWNKLTAELWQEDKEDKALPRNLSVDCIIDGEYDEWDEVMTNRVPKVVVNESRSSARSLVRFRLGDHVITGRLTVPPPVQHQGRPIVASAPQIQLVAWSKAGQQAILDWLLFLTELTMRKSEQPDPNMYVWTRGRFQRVHAPFRPVESVILADGQRERISDDLSTFLANERFYTKRSVPWHRGYLFHGKPGTGKSSLVRGLAKEHGLHLYVVPLGDLENDGDLVNLVGQIGYRCILLLEDIDVYGAVTGRESEKGKASLSGLLNALDGVATPHGLITVMTTNDLDSLDPALVRAGRADLIEEIAPPEPEQSVRLFEYFYEREPKLDWSNVKAPSVAALIEVFKRNLFDADAAEREVMEGLVPIEFVPSDFVQLAAAAEAAW